MSELLLYHLFLALGVVLTLFLVAQILRDRRPPAASLAWLLFILAMPYLAIPVYLVFGVRKVRYPDKKALYSGATHSSRGSRVPELDRLLDSYGLPPAVEGNGVIFHGDGSESLAALWKVIDGAERFLDIAIFILGRDEVGRQVCKRLARRAGEGIRVRLLLDGVGSFLLPRRWVREMREHGVEVRWFVPVLHPPLKGRTNLRNHRKLVLADGRRVWTGGRNLATEYFDSAGLRQRPWLDMSFDLEGPGVAGFQQVFEADWAFSGGGVAEDPRPVAGTAGRATVRLLPSGPDMPEDPLQALLLAICFEARQRILVVTPYFIPDEALAEGLGLAARRGVDVQLLLPQASNHRMADIARNRYLRMLAETGVKIHLQPGVMNHAKMLVMDDRLALCGSANLDPRSLYLNFEIVALFHDQAEIRWLTHWAEEMKRCGRPHHPKRPGALRFMLESVVLLISFQL